jgi:hypothetical protein
VISAAAATQAIPPEAIDTRADPVSAAASPASRLPSGSPVV